MRHADNPITLQCYVYQLVYQYLDFLITLYTVGDTVGTRSYHYMDHPETRL